MIMVLLDEKKVFDIMYIDLFKIFYLVEDVIIVIMLVNKYVFFLLDVLKNIFKFLGEVFY